MRTGGMTQDQVKIVGETEQLLHDARYNPHFAEMMRERGYNEESWAYGESLLADVKNGGTCLQINGLKSPLFTSENVR